MSNHVLLDSGSQANFISCEVLNTLGLTARTVNISISDINGTATRSTQAVQIELCSQLNSFSTVLDCVVTDRVTHVCPSFTVKRAALDLPRNIELADPNFHISSKVDVLIGAELFWNLICIGQIKASSKHPTLQKNDVLSRGSLPIDLIKSHIWWHGPAFLQAPDDRKLIVCFKAKPVISEAKMGSLPTSRVTISRPFTHCGVDYAGPLILRKGMHSDNATTFVGADRQIKELYDFFRSESVQSSVEHFLSDQQVSWSFIPPNAPHFGELWEVVVKSAKLHFTRIVGRTHLTFEEMQTVLCEIEAILNSRSLTPLSSDPNDMTYLSSGNFLVGSPLNSLPTHDLSDVNTNRLSRW
ncbi:hypothetical protein X777_10430 [Ooceraea biroi]|uniref:Uncharacterized protein n=1 Tax=Ooceraea biroi TaxID=2015173 RepID=A0A026W566_OOCBI|nr:hypothetical protein X777_10430 [Ooceraea biroi]